LPLFSSSLSSSPQEEEKIGTVLCPFAPFFEIAEQATRANQDVSVGVEGLNPV
jgi:hypothetical protein